MRIRSVIRVSDRRKSTVFFFHFVIYLLRLFLSSTHIRLSIRLCGDVCLSVLRCSPPFSQNSRFRKSEEWCLHTGARARERQDEEVDRGVKGRGGYDTDTGAKNPHPTLRTYIKLARVYSLKYYIRN